MTRAQLAITAAIVGVLLLTANIARAGGSPYVRVRDSLGGSVLNTIHEIHAFRGTYYLDGACYSACTMRVAKGCVAPGAKLTFHRPSLVGIPMWGKAYARTVRAIARHYPDRLRAWYLREGHRTKTTMTFNELVALGVRPCGQA